MTSRKTHVLAMIAALGLTACAQTRSNHEQNASAGSHIGAMTGSVIGSTISEGSGKTAATIGGALIGIWAGSHIGASLTTQDRVYHAQATQQAYSTPVGEAVAWNNPETGHSGTITPASDGHTTSGKYCRKFQQEININGNTQKALRLACRMLDGQWQIINK